MKIDLDKYYTNDVIVNHYLNVVDNLIIDYVEVIERWYLKLKIL